MAVVPAAPHWRPPASGVGTPASPGVHVTGAGLGAVTRPPRWVRLESAETEAAVAALSSRAEVERLRGELAAAREEVKGARAELAAARAGRGTNDNNNNNDDDDDGGDEDRR